MNEQAKRLGANPLERGDGAPWVLVTGGKGGVGKSTIAANLAFSLGARGVRVLLLDLDLGLADLHVLLRVEAQRTLEDFLEGWLPLDGCLCPVGPNVDLLPAGSGNGDLARPDSARRQRLNDAVRVLSRRYDVVVADAAAGIGPDGLAFTARADLVLLVTTPEPAALTDAYGLLKALDVHAAQQRLDLPTPEVLINFAQDGEEARAAHGRLAAVSERFLARRPQFLGWLPRCREVSEAARTQSPFVLQEPDGLAARAMGRLGDRVIGLLPPGRRRMRA